jgi:Ca-activated chloride channel homolog
MLRNNRTQARQPATILFSTIECVLASIIAGVIACLLLVPVVMLLSNLAGAAGINTGIKEETNYEELPEMVPDGVQQGTLLFRNNDNFNMAPVLKTSVNISVSGIIARVKVKQSFRNPYTGWMEGLYVFPLPENAAVDHLRMYIGQRIIEGQVRERQQARTEYEKARKGGKKASLIEQERPNIFTTTVANIGPNEEITVEIQYQHLVQFDSGLFSLRFPMIVAPRYIPGNRLIEGFSETGLAINTDQVADASRITPPVLHPDNGYINPVELTIHLDTGFPLQHITSSYHNVNINKVTESSYIINLQEETTPANRDFKLYWHPEPARSPRAAFFTERKHEEDYSLIMLIPPEFSVDRRLTRDVIFVIDTSGSMAGTSIKQAREALLLAIKKLVPGDRFNIIQFNSNTKQLFRFPQPVTQSVLEQAENYVYGLEAQGGTEMKPALKAALKTQAENNTVRQIIFLTDGSIGNEHELFEIIKLQLGSSRLFTVGIGSAPNSFFMNRAAKHGHGTYTYIGKQTEVREKMQTLFNKIEHTVLTAINIDWGNVNGLEYWPQKFPDLYFGEPLLITAKTTTIPDVIKISGVISGNEWQTVIKPGAGGDNTGISVLWAREKIAALMDQYGSSNEKNDLRHLIVNTALKYQLVSKFTSLVAIDISPSRTNDKILKTVNLPVNLPAGWEYEKVFGQLPTTATAAELHLLIGLILLLAGILLSLIYRHVSFI